MHFLPGQTAEAGSPVKELSSSEATSYIAAVLASAEYKSFKRRLAQDYTGALQVQEERSSALKFQGYVCVVVPVLGGTGHSAYIAWFSKNSERITTAGYALYTLDSEGNIVGQVAHDGKTVVDATIKPSGEIVRGIVYNSDGTRTILQAGSFPIQKSVGTLAISDPMCCITGCLSAMGIPAYIITFVAISCGLACLIPGAAGLVACVACVSWALGAWLGLGLRCVYNCYACIEYNGCTAC